MGAAAFEARDAQEALDKALAFKAQGNDVDIRDVATKLPVTIEHLRLVVSGDA